MLTSPKNGMYEDENSELKLKETRIKTETSVQRFKTKTQLAYVNRDCDTICLFFSKHWLIKIPAIIGYEYLIYSKYS